MKKLNYFQSIDPTDKSGAVAWSPFIDPEQVVEAYEHGIFPWPDEEESIYWFSPLQRGVLDFKNLKWSKRDLRFFRNCSLAFKINSDFERMIRTCAAVKVHTESSTWITEDLIATYISLHEQKIAMSFEVYEGRDLVGGLYGVMSEKYFSAESMFYLKPNASKFALFKTVEFLQGLGMSWIDTQVVTDFTSRLGALEIPRAEFLSRIK